MRSRRHVDAPAAARIVRSAGPGPAGAAAAPGERPGEVRDPAAWAAASSRVDERPRLPPGERKHHSRVELPEDDAVPGKGPAEAPRAACGRLRNNAAAGRREKQAAEKEPLSNKEEPNRSRVRSGQG